MELSRDFWDCECVGEYIQPNTLEACPRCGAMRDEQPPARIDEIQRLMLLGIRVTALANESSMKAAHACIARIQKDREEDEEQ